MYILKHHQHGTDYTSVFAQSEDWEEVLAMMIGMVNEGPVGDERRLIVAGMEAFEPSVLAHASIFSDWLPTERFWIAFSENVVDDLPHAFEGFR